MFHQGQLVAPPDLPERPLPTLLTGDDRWQHVWTAVIAQLADEGYPVELHTARPGETWNGRTHFDDGHVEVMDHLDPPQRLKTLLHEWAHVTLRHGDVDRPPTRELLEIEAESVAYLLCRTIDLDSPPATRSPTSPAGPTATSSSPKPPPNASSPPPPPWSTPSKHACRSTSPPTCSPPPATAPPHRRPPCGHRSAAASTEVGDRDRPPTPIVPARPGRSRARVELHPDTDRSHGAAGASRRPRPARHVGSSGAARRCRRLDRADDRGVAVALCADAGLDTAATAAALIAVGADPVRAAPNDEAGHHRQRRRRATLPVRQRRRRLPCRRPPSHLDAGDRRAARAVRRRRRRPRRRRRRLLASGGQHRPAEIVEVLTYLGVAEPDIRGRAQSTSRPIEPPTGATTRRRRPRPTSMPARCCATGSPSTRALIRRIVDEERNPARVAALATGLGMSYRETVAACAHLGLDPGVHRPVAVARRHGDITHAAADLAAGWTAPPPADGWSTYLTPPGRAEPPTPPHVPEPATSAARAVLAQWRQAAMTPPRHPAMT